VHGQGAVEIPRRGYRTANWDHAKRNDRIDSNLAVSFVNQAGEVQTFALNVTLQLERAITEMPQDCT
jgi:hypothetical protein